METKKGRTFAECLEIAGIEIKPKKPKKPMTFDECLKTSGFAGDEWRTIHGAHVEINENGEIIRGAGGKLNGLKKSQVGSGKTKTTGTGRKDVKATIKATTKNITPAISKFEKGDANYAREHAPEYKKALENEVKEIDKAREALATEMKNLGDMGVKDQHKVEWGGEKDVDASSAHYGYGKYEDFLQESERKNLETMARHGASGYKENAQDTRKLQAASDDLKARKNEINESLKSENYKYDLMKDKFTPELPKLTNEYHYNRAEFKEANEQRDAYVKAVNLQMKKYPSREEDYREHADKALKDTDCNAWRNGNKQQREVENMIGKLNEL